MRPCHAMHAARSAILACATFPLICPLMANAGSKVDVVVDVEALPHREAARFLLIRLTGISRSPRELTNWLPAALQAMNCDTYVARLADEYWFFADRKSDDPARVHGAAPDPRRDTMRKPAGPSRGRSPYRYVAAIRLSVESIEPDGTWHPPNGNRTVRVIVREPEIDLESVEGVTWHLLRRRVEVVQASAPTGVAKVWRIHRATGRERAPSMAPAAVVDTATAGFDSSRAAPSSRLAIRALDSGARTGGALELTLTSRAPAHVEWIDVQGRRCASVAVVAPEPGARRIDSPSDALTSGVYWACLRQSGARVAARVLIVR